MLARVRENFVDFTLKLRWGPFRCVRRSHRRVIGKTMTTREIASKAAPQRRPLRDQLLQVLSAHGWKHLQKRLVDLGGSALRVAIHRALALRGTLHGPSLQLSETKCAFCVLSCPVSRALSPASRSSLDV